MKNIVFFTAILFFISCQKDDDISTSGEAFATSNGKAWEGSPYASAAPAYPEDHIGIVAELFNEHGLLREEISFHRIPLEKNRYDLGRIYNPHTYPYVGAAFFTLLDDGDVLGDIYLLDTLATGNYFEVLSYSENQKEIEVKFAATFLLDKRANADAPDTLKFEDGYIKTKVNF
jgi:hypothetical protein